MCKAMKSKKEKKSSIKINLAMSVQKTWYFDMHDYNLYVKGKKKIRNKGLEPW